MAGVYGIRGDSARISTSFWIFQHNISAGGDAFGSGSYFVEVSFQRGPVIGPEFKDGELAARQVLLIPEIFVRNDEQGEAILFRELQEFAVADAAPAHLLRCGNFVADQCVTNLNGHALVERDYIMRPSGGSD